MSTVKVGELRNHLSAYLKKVKGGGEVIIADRDTPVGRLIPYKARTSHDRLKLIPPSKGYEGLAKLNFPDIESTVDPLKYLLEERSRR